MAKIVWHGNEILEAERQRVVAAMTRAGFRIVPVLQAVTPVETGTAQRSVTFEVEEGRNRVTLRYGGQVSYFIWIEIGTHGRPGAAPLARTLSEALAIVKEELGRR